MTNVRNILFIHHELAPQSHAWMEMLNQQLKELSEDYLNLMETIFRLRLDNV